MRRLEPLSHQKLGRRYDGVTATTWTDVFGCTPICELHVDRERGSGKW